VRVSEVSESKISERIEQRPGKRNWQIY